MTERCTNCGAPLYRGQQFCRKCGAATQQLAGEAPTQMLPHETQGATTPAPASNATSPLQRGATDQTWASRPTEQQTPFGHANYTSPVGSAAVVQTPAKRRRWVLPVVIGLLLVVGLCGAMLAVMISRGAFKKRVVMAERGVPRPPAMPGAPASIDAEGAALLDEAGAVVSGDKTVITKSLALHPDATLSIRNFSGDIRVEGWHEERAEVKIIKRGGSAEERRGTRVTLANDEDHLSLAAAGGGGPVEVVFEIKVPSGLQKVDISSANSEVRVSKLEAPLVINVKTGSIKLEDVRGEAHTSIFSGTTKVSYGDGGSEGEQEFSSVNGDIEVQLADRVDADLKAEVVQGDIEVDDALGLRVQKRMVGRKLEGRIGEGGETLSIKTVNGTIKIKK